MHALSFGTWWIHVASVFEWLLAMVLIAQRGSRGSQMSMIWLSAAMIPALISAMAACTWHLYDNAESLRWLVTLQASTTLLGNVTLAIAAWNLQRDAPVDMKVKG
ncbi:DUF2499 domain-containing protein [Synechococcus sp. WH 8016]|uniref:DUF2499 domain-containing protein n=1 Tax=Synechococcus sp. WH 8016 TaxID=166318 RepID=UPI00022DA133|nr:DUF2499 domain-containing protein [Synechococcus sp. WH 8016]EHA63439.1 Protein of unknown function DUF2499 [Synechococcus sp. WH 8016]